MFSRHFNLFSKKNLKSKKKKFRLSTKIQTNKTIFTHELWVFDFFHTRVFNFFPHISGWVFCVCAVWNLKKKITSVFFKTKNFQTHKCIWKKTFVCVALDCVFYIFVWKFNTMSVFFWTLQKIYSLFIKLHNIWSIKKFPYWQNILLFSKCVYAMLIDKKKFTYWLKKLNVVVIKLNVNLFGVTSLYLDAQLLRLNC